MQETSLFERWHVGGHPLGLGTMPPAFTEDRRGKAAREERNYALLADLYQRTARALYEAEWEAMEAAFTARSQPKRRREWSASEGRWPAPRSGHYPVLEMSARHVARFWAERYGGAVKTWRQRLTHARRYVHHGDDGRIHWADDERGFLWLTEPGFRLVYRCEYADVNDLLIAFGARPELFSPGSLNYDEVSAVLGVPAVEVPRQPVPPRRRYPDDGL